MHADCFRYIRFPRAVLKDRETISGVSCASFLEPGLKTRACRATQAGFAVDSLVEGVGFELSVSLARIGVPQGKRPQRLPLLIPKATCCGSARPSGAAKIAMAEPSQRAERIIDVVRRVDCGHAK